MVDLHSMSDDLVKQPPTALALQDAVPGLVELWLQSQTPNTRRAYQVSVQDFAKSIGAEQDTAVMMLLAGRGPANALALAYRIDLGRRGKANSTVNLRLSALRSLVAHARSLDLVDWALEIKGVAQKQYRDTRGPGRAGFMKMLEAAKKSPSAARVLTPVRIRSGSPTRSGGDRLADEDRAVG
jgi:hypothetical protein